MNSIQLMEALGNIDDEMIERANQKIAVKPNKIKGHYLLVKAACLILGCMLIYKIPIVNATANNIITGVQKITGHYNEESLDTYKVRVNQSQSLDGLRMTVNEVVLESDRLIVQCNFRHENVDIKDDTVQTNEWPFCFKLKNSNETLLDTKSPDDIITAAYDSDHACQELIFTINLQGINDVSKLLKHNLEMTFYYDNGALKGQGYTFNFTPTKIYQVKSHDLNDTYQVKSYGKFSIKKIVKEALYLDFKLTNNLKSSENDEFDFKLVDEEGNEYLQMRKYDKDILFVRPNNLNQKLFMEVMLIKFDKNGVGTEQMIDKYSIPSIE